MPQIGVLQSTFSLMRSAVELYFQPLVWIRQKLGKHPDTKSREDFVLESRHLVGLFTLLVVIFGVVFTLGYELGASQYDSKISAEEISVFSNVRHASEGEIVLQIAVVKQERDALAVAHALQQMKFPVFIVKSKADKIYSIQVGPFTDGQSAAMAIRDLDAKGSRASVKD